MPGPTSRKTTTQWGSWNPPKLNGIELVQELPVTPEQAAIANRIEAASGHGKHAARSALFHLGRAWSIRSIDPEMAAFRAITAEEEAASAIMLALVRREYPGSGRLQRTDHRHKAAVIVFVTAAVRAISTPGIIASMKPTLMIPTKDPSKPIVLQFTLPFLERGGSPVWVKPDAPLNMQLNLDGVPYDFAAEMKTIAQQANAQTLDEHVRNKATARNHILYARPNGIPMVDPANMDDHVLARRDDVFRLLILFDMIDGHSQQQLLVVQALEALLGQLAAQRTNRR